MDSGIASSPGTSSLGFFIYYSKDAVYINKSGNICVLKVRIMQETQNITPDVLQNVIWSFSRGQWQYLLAKSPNIARNTEHNTSCVTKCHLVHFLVVNGNICDLKV